MGIESIGSIGRVASVAPSLGRSGFSVSRIANPFSGVPKTPSFTGLKVEVLKNPFVKEIVSPKPQMRAADVITKAAKRPVILERKTTGIVVGLPNPARDLDVRVITNPRLAPKVEFKPFQAAKLQPEAQVKLYPRQESNPTSRVRRIVSPAPLTRVQTEQVVEEKKVIKEQKNEPETRKRKKQSILKIKFTEAVGISKNRIAALKEAFKKTRAEGLSAKWLRKFLGKEYWEQKSPITRKGYDGTLDPTVRDLEAHGDEIKSDQEVENTSAQAVSNHIPVQKGDGGRLATRGEVREVLEGKNKEILRSNTPAELVIRRVVEKNVEVIKSGQVMVSSLEREEAKETDLKDLGLEEVFPKAANKPLDIY